MKKMKISMALLLTGLFFSGSAFALCDKKHEGKECDKEKAGAYYKQRGVKQGGDIETILASEKLDLTTEQRVRLQEMKQAFDKEAIMVRAKIKVKRVELEELLKKDNASADAVTVKVKEISDLNGELLLKGTLTRLKVREVLTPEQLKIARELIEKKREGNK